MLRLFTNELMAQMSLKGRKGKVSFSTLQVASVVTGYLVSFLW